MGAAQGAKLVRTFWLERKLEETTTEPAVAGMRMGWPAGLFWMRSVRMLRRHDVRMLRRHVRMLRQSRLLLQPSASVGGSHLVAEPVVDRDHFSTQE